MKIRSLLLSLGLLASGAVVYAMQDGMGEMPQPSPEHKRLALTIGTWDAAVDMGEAEPAKGVMTVVAGPGGFSTMAHFDCAMGPMGPFEGREISGYDPDKKKYVTVWVDSWTPAPLVMEGTYDEKSKASTMYGDMLDQMTGKVTKHKFVTTWKTPDHMEFVITGPGADGKDMTKLTINYTRKK